MNRTLRVALIANASFVAITLAAASANAQGADQVETVVVTGFRNSLENAINAKRQSATVIDAISAEDVGKFPDTNIAEAVQRITGVQINRTRGEGRTINIRGLPANFTLITMNGRSVANATVNSESSITRSFDLSMLPSEFIRTLEVYKAPTADLEEGGLSGAVNIRTPRPFDIGRRVITASAEGSWESNSGNYSPRLSGFYSDVFAGDRVGVSLGVSYQQRQPETHTANMNWTTSTEGNGIGGAKNLDLDGNGVVQASQTVRIPAGTLYSIYQENSRRLSVIGSAQVKVNENLVLYGDVFYTQLNLLDIRNEHLNIFNNGNAIVAAQTSSVVLDGYPTATHFGVQNLDLRGGSRTEDRHGDAKSFVGGLQWDNGNWHVNVEGGLSNSQQILQNLNLATIARGTAAITGDVGQDLVSVTYLDGFDTARMNPSSFNVLSLNGEFNRHSRATNNDVGLKMTKDFGSRFLGIDAIHAGVKYEYAAIYQDNNNLSVTAAGVSKLYGGLPVGTTSGSFTAAPFMVVKKPGNGTFLDGYGGSVVFPKTWIGSDTRAFTTQFTDEQLQAAGTLTNTATGITDVSEKQLSAYAQADFGFGESISGNVGVRMVRTQQHSVGVAPDLSNLILDLTSGFKTIVPPAEPVDVTRSYTNWLPSFNLKWEVTDDLLVRFAASRTMARPNLGDIAPTTSADANALTITQNNPYLDPFKSNNYDVTTEWYFATGGLVGTSLFYKEIESLIRRVTVVQNRDVTVRDNTGDHIENRAFSYSVLQNGAGVTVKGAEFYYQQNFTFLPSPFDGLGSQLNFTFIENSDPTQLTAASKYNFNATAFYEQGPIAVRVAYAWRGKFLLSAPVAPAMSVNREAYGTIDASLTYQMFENVSIVLEGSNLTDSAEIDRYTTGIPNTYQESGRRITFGVRISL